MRTFKIERVPARAAAGVLVIILARHPRRGKVKGRVGRDAHTCAHGDLLVCHRERPVHPPQWDGGRP